MASHAVSPYNDPRWQRLRLEVMQRDNFSCKRCAGKDSPLHIHHKTYRNGVNLWDYPMDNFVTLCEEFHEQASAIVSMIREESHRLHPVKVSIIYELATNNFSVEELLEIYSHIRDFLLINKKEEK